MRRPDPKFLWAFLLIILSGCAHLPDTRSIRHKQAMEWANQGEKAYRSGNFEPSRRYYESALQLNITIENAHGIASNTLSLAQINLDRAEYDQADTRLQSILGDKNDLFAAGDKADAAARSAQSALLQKQPGRAAELAMQARSFCQKANCAFGAAILNLQAQAAMALGKNDESADLAGQAGNLAEKAHQPAELANSRRLLGKLQLHQKSAITAIPLLDQALSLDKQLGFARKIADDLHLLADAKDMLGQPEDAESCRNRERAIRRALGDKWP